MATPDFQNGPGGMEGLERLKTPQSSFTFARRARPPPIQLSTGTEDNRVPLNPQNLQRRDSKGGLRGIFTRNKVEKAIVSPVQEEAPPPSAVSEMTMKVVGEASLERSMSVQRTASVPAETAITPARPTTKSSRMNLRSKSVKQSKTPSKPSPKSSTKTEPSRPTRTSATWDPPPLFQAYPQAIKHAQLTASTLSADSILRISNHRRNNSLTEYSQSQTVGDEQGQSAAAKKTEKARNKHRRQVSGSISKADWTQKIFVLVTSGYLLQYSGDGSFDRLPEKMMQLGKDSVAFASDVIPGKHWVLQISQSMDADGAPTVDSRSLLSRLTFRGADYRRTATSLLLIFGSAEEMDSWIAVVRREIEALGGKKHVSETGRPKPDDKVMQFKAQPSHRYLVQRDPDQFSNPASPISPSFGLHPWSRANSMQTNVEETSSSMAWPHLIKRPTTSTDQRSAVNSVTSHDGRQLEELRNSSNRLSYMSSGQRTFVTSQCSSPEPSPTRDSNSTTFEDITPKVSMEESQARPNASAISERRRSMQTLPIPVLESQNLQKIYRHSAYGPAATTPNFSVPNSSSRRYSAIKTNVKVPANASTPNRTNEPALKGSRKAPPPAISVARTLSPVKDSPSPRRVPVFTPTESSFKTVQQIKASVVDIPPRSPLATPSPIEVNPPKRRSSLMQLTSPGTCHLEFQFPRRHSSMLALRDAVEPSNNHPRRPSPLPAAALTTALPKSPFENQDSEKVITEQEREHLSPLPNIANTKSKLRRPNSMQIRPSILSPRSHTTIVAKSTRMAPPISSTTQISHANRPSSIVQASGGAKSPGLKPISPSLQRLRLESNAKALATRRSMPVLVGGPPPAPPPNCALPPLPPPGTGLRSGSAVGSRTSVRR